VHTDSSEGAATASVWGLASITVVSAAKLIHELIALLRRQRRRETTPHRRHGVAGAGGRDTSHAVERARPRLAGFLELAAGALNVAELGQGRPGDPVRDSGGFVRTAWSPFSAATRHTDRASAADRWATSP
jgi:hypothetical protein